MKSDSYIHESFKFGENFKIGKFCVIEQDVIVGNNVKIENYILLKSGTRIGNNCFIDSYVRSSGENKIGNNCTIRYSATIAKDVIIDDNVFISPNVMTIYSNPDGGHGTPTYISKGAFIGTAAVLKNSITISDGVVIGAMSYVNMDCKKENGIYVGQPAKYIGQR